MAYNLKLAARVREYLDKIPGIKVEEKKMFSGLAFIVNDKMCINVSGEKLMCRFDPNMQEEVAANVSYQPMIMRSKELKGYCYVEPAGFQSNKAFEYWVKLCLQYNAIAKSSKKTKVKRSA